MTSPTPDNPTPEIAASDVPIPADASSVDAAHPAGISLGTTEVQSSTDHPSESVAQIKTSGRKKKVWAGAGAGIAVLTVIGVVAGFMFMGRPDVTLARAWSATTAAGGIDATASVHITDAGFAALGSASPGADEATVKELVSNATFRLIATSVDPADPQFSFSTAFKGTDLAAFTVTNRTVYLSTNLSALEQLAPKAAPDLTMLTKMINSPELGIPASVKPVLSALLDGKPVAVPFGSDTTFGKAYDKALADPEFAASVGKLSSPAAGAAWTNLLDAVPDALKANATITNVGNDNDGEHLRVSTPLAATLNSLKPALSSYLTALGATSADVADGTDTSKVTGTLVVDAWVKDGKITAAQVDLGSLIDASSHSTGVGAAKVTVPAGAVVLRVTFTYPPKITAPSGAIVIDDTVINDTAGWLKTTGSQLLPGLGSGSAAPGAPSPF
ncbi:MAG: hypothetical protein ABI468_03120 [Candidatus Nanopelagicales bacterium]